MLDVGFREKAFGVASAAMAVLGALFFLHGTEVGAGWHKSPRARRCVAGLVAFAYFVLWIALLVRSRAQPALFWDRLLTPEAFLARLVTPESFFILAAYAVGLSALTANDVPAFFRAGFHYLHVVRRLGRWLPDSSVADGWLAVTPFALHVGVAKVITLAAIRALDHGQPTRRPQGSTAAAWSSRPKR